MGDEMLNISESSGNNKNDHKLDLVKNESVGESSFTAHFNSFKRSPPHGINEQCEGEGKAR